MTSLPENNSSELCRPFLVNWVEKKWPKLVRGDAGSSIPSFFLDFRKFEPICTERAGLSHLPMYRSLFFVWKIFGFYNCSKVSNITGRSSSTSIRAIVLFVFGWKQITLHSPVTASNRNKSQGSTSGCGVSFNKAAKSFGKTKVVS